MKYYVIEIQTNADGTSGNFVFCFDNRADTDAKYGTLYAAAAKSSVLVHTIIMLTDRGDLLAKKAFVHPVGEEE